MPDSVADTFLRNQRDQSVGGLVPKTDVSGATLTIQPTVSNGNALSLQKVISAATTNALSIKGTAGRLYTLYAQNTTASWKFIKFYNKASAPTVGTDTPVITLGVPPNGTLMVVDPLPFAFATGVAMAITGASPDADATATAVGDVLATVGYM